jgi:hypothetical protein
LATIGGPKAHPRFPRLAGIPIARRGDASMSALYGQSSHHLRFDGGRTVIGIYAKEFYQKWE